MIPLTGWINTDAKNQVKCPKCGQLEGFNCKTPKGAKAQTHGHRIQAYFNSIPRDEFDARHLKSSINVKELLS